MSQHDSLRKRSDQHKPKNDKSKMDDKDVYKSKVQIKKDYRKEKKSKQQVMP